MRVQETDHRISSIPSPFDGKSWVRLLPFLTFCAIPALVLAVLWNSLAGDELALQATRLRWGVAGAGVLAGFLLVRTLWPRQSFLESLSLSVVGVAAGFMAMAYLQDVNPYPFKLYWSEGNRFYDYSLVFGNSLYLSEKPPQMLYNEPGRYALWGILFLVRELPIWVHRLWNALLFTVPLLAAGLLLASWTPQSAVRRGHFSLWVFLLLIQGPIYPSLVISAILVLVSAGWGRVQASEIGGDAKSLLRLPGYWLKLGVVFLAGYYVALSRWTWIAAPGVWAGLLAFLWEEHGSDSTGLKGWLPVFNPKARTRALLEAVLLAIAGMLGGVLAKPGLLLAPEQATGFALQQPLLLYRLFPNATFGPGILLSLVFAAGPLVLWLAWLGISRSWRLSWLQAAAAALPALAFLGLGTVASTKIGGGSNLHNLDMFLITLAILTGLAVRALAQKNLPLWGTVSQPAWRLVIQGVMALAVFVPALSAFQAGAPVRLPPEEAVKEALRTIQSEVDQAQAQGEVLFMDQRQLLTFDYIHNVRLVHEYEMKYMMDQSMSGDASLFRQFYDDLARRRFELIVVHPLTLQYQGREHNFGEENDAWVKWVAEAILCSYRPKATFKNVNVQLLEPRPTPRNNCP